MLDKLKGYKRIIALGIFIVTGALQFTNIINKETAGLIETLATALGVYGTWDALKDK